MPADALTDAFFDGLESFAGRARTWPRRWRRPATPTPTFYELEKEALFNREEALLHGREALG